MPRNLWLVLVAAVVVGACGRDAGRDGSLTAPAQPRGAAVSANNYLPLHARVAPTDTLRALPEPYSRARYGAPVPLAIAPIHPIGVMPPDHGRRRGDLHAAQLQPAPDPTPDHVWRNIVVENAGFMVLSSARLDLSLPPTADTVRNLYAPTNYPSDHSCIEATVVHRRAPGASMTDHYVGLWNWCVNSNDFQILLPMISTSFQNSYVRMWQPDANTPAQQVVYLSIMSDNLTTNGSCWDAFLYDFNAGGWTMIQGNNPWCGTPVRTFMRGWSAWESWGYVPFSGPCPTVPPIEAFIANIFRDGGGYTAPQASDIFGYGFQGTCWNGSYWWEDRQPGYWYAHTPV